jgi:hypothetical protein
MGKGYIVSVYVCGCLNPLLLDEDMRLFFFMSTLVPVNVDMLISEQMAHLNTEVL